LTSGVWEEQVEVMSQVSEHTLALEGMHCGACVRRARAAVEAIEGARIVTLEVGRARIEANEEALLLVRRALSEAGFPAEPAS